MRENMNICVPLLTQGRYLVGISGTQVLRQIDSKQFPEKSTPVDSEEEKQNVKKEEEQRSEK